MSKQFNSKIWCVLYRNTNEEKWKVLSGKKGYWYADPILLNYQGKKYLFTEAFSMINQIGYLAVSEYVDNKFTTPSIIMKQSFHMSYPCVFEYNHHLYMIPETGQNGTLELWEACNDIYTWKKTATLKKHIKYADNTVYIKNNLVYLFSYEEGKSFITHLFHLDMDNFELEELETIENSTNIKRPAGKFFTFNKNLYRPLQNNVSQYGESILINKVSSLKPFKEDTVYEISADYYGKSYQNMNTHTLSIDNEIMVVDLLKPVNLPFYYRMTFLRKIRNLLFKIRFKLRMMVEVKK